MEPLRSRLGKWKLNGYQALRRFVEECPLVDARRTEGRSIFGISFVFVPSHSILDVVVNDEVRLPGCQTIVSGKCPVDAINDVLRPCRFHFVVLDGMPLLRGDCLARCVTLQGCRETLRGHDPIGDLPVSGNWES